MPRKIRVIIVDDEARLRRGIERLVLSNQDAWDVIGSFSSGTECLEAIEETKMAFDLLITDVKMPGIDGLTLIKKLKDITTFYSVVISGFDDFQYLQTAIREGASDYFIKPINRDEFRAQLENIKQKIVAQWEDDQYFEEIEKKASQLTHVKQTQMLSEMTRKQEVDLSLLEWTKDFPKGSYQLIYVSMDNLIRKTKSFQKEDWNAWTFAIDNICDELLERLHAHLIQSWRWKDKDLSFWVLLHLQKSEMDSFGQYCSQFAEELRMNIRRFTPFTSSIAISDSIHELTLLPSAKDELLTYIQFRLLYDGNQIFSKEVVDSFQANKKLIGSKEMENQIHKLIFSLEHKNKEGIELEIDRFINTIQALDSPEKIGHVLNLLGMLVINFMLKNSHTVDEIPRINEVFSFTKKIANISELKEVLREWINEVLNYLDRKDKSQNLDHISLAKKWIAQHLNENITIQKIASQVYMNPTYICEYFKNQTGETVLDFVTRIRMEKARDLLLTTNLKIYDISVKVGYTDTKYFSKLFKKQLGETPSKYREKIILDQT